MMKLFAIMNDKFLIILTLIVVAMMVKIIEDADIGNDDDICSNSSSPPTL